MAVRIPLITDFDGRGIDKAKREFAQLEGAGKKSAFLLKKAFIPATAAIGGLAEITFDAVKSAIEDEKAQAQLERTIKATTKATDKQIDALNDYITNAGKSFGITDDDLRPAMQRLATATTDVEESMRLATLAMDISTATGKPLEDVADALGKAFNGQYLALNKLDPSLRDVVKSGGDADEVFGRLNDKFGGAAQANAETAAGKFQIFKVRMDELKESIGASLLPVLDEMLPYLDKFATWAEENPGTFKAVAATIAAVAGAIVLVNLAMAANPIVLIAAAVVGLATVMALNWPTIKKWFEDFRAELDKTLGPLDEFVALFIEGFGEAFNLGKKLFGTRPFPANPSQRDTPRRMATGGLVMAPTRAIIGEAGPEMVIPLDRLSEFGGGNNVVINVNGGDPNAVVDALRRYMVTNGPVPITVA